MINIFELVHRHGLAGKCTSAGLMSVKQELARVARNLLERHGLGIKMLEASRMCRDLNAIVQTEHVGFDTRAGDVNLVLVANENTHIFFGLQDHVVGVQYLKQGIKNSNKIETCNTTRHDEKGKQQQARTLFVTALRISKAGNLLVAG